MYTCFDAIFSFRRVFRMLMERFPGKGAYGTEYDVEYILSKKDISILEVLDGKAIYKAIKEASNNISSRTWAKRFEVAIEKYTGLVHTIGNYMPCPDDVFNSYKGFSSKWKYNDRLELLYKSLHDDEDENMKKFERRDAWNEWFEKNAEQLYVNNILNNEILLRFPVQTTTFNEMDICYFIEWLEEANKQIEERIDYFLFKHRREVYEQIKNYYESSLDIFPNESIYLYHSFDDKGYIWVRKDQIENFEKIILPYEDYYRVYDNEKPIDKLIGEKGCPSGYREYAYIPYYDCRDALLNEDLDYLVSKILFETMRDKKLMLEYE